MANEEIFEIIGFNEESWRKDIPYLRKLYMRLVKECNLKVISKVIMKKFTVYPIEAQHVIESLDYQAVSRIAESILEDIDTVEIIQELINKLEEIVGIY